MAHTVQHDAVVCRNLTVRFGEKVILDGVDLRVPRGSRTAVLADNGAGKTTLLSALGTAQREGVSGQLRLLGCDVGEGVTETELAFLRRSVPLVWQQALVESDVSCYANLATVAAFRGVPRRDRRREIERALELVGLSGRAQDRSNILNGGGKRLLAIARALVGTRGGLLLADEPTANFSEDACRRLLKLFRYLTNLQGYTIIVATHDVAWAREFTDTLYRLQHGRLQRLKPPLKPEEFQVGTTGSKIQEVGTADAATGGHHPAPGAADKVIERMRRCLDELTILTAARGCDSLATPTPPTSERQSARNGTVANAGAMPARSLAPLLAGRELLRLPYYPLNDRPSNDSEKTKGGDR